MSAIPRRRTVAVVRTSPETYAEDLGRALRLLRSGRPSPTSAGSPIVALGPGRDADRPEGGAPPWTVDALLSRLRPVESGAETVANPAPPCVLLSVDGRIGRATERVLVRHGVQAETPLPEEVVPSSLADLPWIGGRRGGEIRCDPRLRGRELWVLARARRSRRLVVRGAVEAAIGMLGTASERSVTPLDPQAWGELLRLQRALHPRSIHVLDATVWGSDDDRDGPWIRDLIVVGEDPVACDLAAVRLAGHDPSGLQWLRRVAEVAGSPAEVQDLRWAGPQPPEELAARPVRPTPRGIPSASRRWERWWDGLRPTRWTARWRARKWNESYRASPWGRLEYDYRERGRPRPADEAPGGAGENQ